MLRYAITLAEGSAEHAWGLIGGFIVSLLGLGGNGDIVNILIATTGAVLLLRIYRLVKSRSA